MKNPIKSILRTKKSRRLAMVAAVLAFLMFTDPGKTLFARVIASTPVLGDLLRPGAGSTAVTAWGPFGIFPALPHTGDLYTPGANTRRSAQRQFIMRHRINNGRWV